MLDDAASRQIYEVRRTELVKLLDKIEDNSGPRMAHVSRPLRLLLAPQRSSPLR
jgi:hypothetical protein